jgi:hypothetical protein
MVCLEAHSPERREGEEEKGNISFKCAAKIGYLFSIAERDIW